MQAVDTNVLVRILIDDHKQKDQVKSAREFAKKAKKLFIPQLVQGELVWVLSVAYALKREEIIYILRQIYENEAFVLQNLEQFGEALQLYQSSTADFSDCLILTASLEVKAEVVSFDKKFAKIPQVKLLAV